MTGLLADVPRCVVCNAQESTQVRLCLRCNAGLCLFEDDPGGLPKATSYLEAAVGGKPA
jgi:hypothetical protein